MDDIARIWQFSRIPTLSDEANAALMRISRGSVDVILMQSTADRIRVVANAEADADIVRADPACTGFVDDRLRRCVESMRASINKSYVEVVN